MRLMIVPEWFAPKIDKIETKIHCLYFLECNFNCIFCSQYNRNEYVQLTEYDPESFREKVKELIKTSSYFKLTGGEPSLQPDILEIVKIINECGGKVLFDTNGSVTSKTKKMIDIGLIYALGLSLKGLDPNEAMRKSGVNNKKLCWDNVIDICNYAYEKTTVILTYVVDSSTSPEDVLQFCKKIINEEIKVNFFKINNLYGRSLPDQTLQPMKSELLLQLFETILKTYPELKDRLIGIPNFGAVTNRDVILHF